MNVDTKFPAFRSFLSENRLNNGGVKTTIDQSAVSAGEQANVDLNLNSEDGKNGNEKFQKNKKNNLDFLKDKKIPVVEVKKTDDEVKTINMKLLYII